MVLSQANLRRKIYGCWLGKAVGGTLGTPHEGKPGPLALSFYDPVPTTSLPNDDLDLQVVWLHHLRSTRATAVTPEILADAWQRHVLFPFDEYAIARRNRAWGLHGPAQGATDNFFGECMGAAIRSEIWACIAPGDPARAAGFAWADAVVDHCGEGVLAEVFHAVIESAAFQESDRDRLIEVGLSYLPEGSRLKRALRDTLAWWREKPDWMYVRGRVVDRYYTGNFTDVVCNLCFELIGWMDGNGDFGRSICTAVNCGLDTDCTGATLGALLGILDPASIPARWRQPIGEEVVLSDAIVNLTKPRDLDELTAWTLTVRDQLAAFKPQLGPILPHQAAQPATARRSLSAEVYHLPDAEILDAGQPVSPAGTLELRLAGFWSQWTANSFAERTKVLRLRFELPEARDVKLMTFYKPRATAWIDGRRVLQITEEAITADPFIAPSFHRAAAASVILPQLAAGSHELMLALEAPEHGSTADLVFGLADPTTNLWLPEVFQDAQPACVSRP